MEIFRLPNINEAIQRVNTQMKERVEREIQRLEQERVTTIATLEKNRQVLPLVVEAVGTEAVDVPHWCNGTVVRINLGHKPQKRSRRLRAIFDRKLISLREALGNLEDDGKEVYDATKQLVLVSLRSKEYPEVKVRFITKLPNDAKCKLVKTRHKAYTSTDLVCEIQP